MTEEDEALGWAILIFITIDEVSKMLDDIQKELEE